MKKKITDTDRINFLQGRVKSYGHDWNEFPLTGLVGPYSNIRKCIDEAIKNRTESKTEG